MMDLKTQAVMLLFSFFFGAFFSLMVDICHSFLYSHKRIFQIFFTFFFVVINTLFYFIILKIINEGIIHIYAILCIILGFFAFDVLKGKIVKKGK